MPRTKELQEIENQVNALGLGDKSAVTETDKHQLVRNLLAAGWVDAAQAIGDMSTAELNDFLCNTIFG